MENQCHVTHKNVVKKDYTFVLCEFSCLEPMPCVVKLGFLIQFSHLKLFAKYKVLSHRYMTCII